MLEAFIDPNSGDVIVVKPAGSIWGSEETAKVMLIEDDALEAEMLAAGESVMAYPYAVYEEIDE